MSTRKLYTLWCWLRMDPRELDIISYTVNMLLRKLRSLLKAKSHQHRGGAQQLKGMYKLHKIKIKTYRKKTYGRIFTCIYIYIYIYIYIIFFFKPMPPAVEVQSPNHWTTREFPHVFLKKWKSRVSFSNYKWSKSKE